MQCTVADIFLFRTIFSLRKRKTTITVYINADVPTHQSIFVSSSSPFCVMKEVLSSCIIIIDAVTKLHCQSVKITVSA